MRTKTRGGKPRISSSLPSSNPSLISLPLLYKDEANEECHVDGNNHGASEDTGSSQDNNQDNNDYDDDDDDAEVDDYNGDGGGDGYYNNVVVPDSVEEADRCEGENHGAGPSRDCIVLDWLVREFCIKCNSRSGQVLVCSENGCPVAIHEVCMNCKPKFDDIGKFYCPYCWYKRELARTKELRRDAMLAKTKLSDFICLKRDGGNEKRQEDETENMKAATVSIMTGKINTGDCENGLNDDDNERIHHNQEETAGVESISKEKSDEERNSRAHSFENYGDGERREEEDIENASDSEDEIDEDQWQIQPFSSSHLEIVKNTLLVSTKDTSDTVGVLEENQGKSGKEEPVLPNAVGTSKAPITSAATSKVRAIESFEFVAPDLDTETLVVRRKRVKRTAQRAWLQKVDPPKKPSFQTYTEVKYKKVNIEGSTKQP